MFRGKRSTTKRTLAFLVLLVACCGGVLWFGATRNQSIIRLNDPHTAQAEVLKHIPIGSDIRQAESVLEKSGFECVFLEHNKYGSSRANNFALAQQTLKNPQLWGRKNVTWLGIPTSYWSVTIGYKNLRVTHVYASNTAVGFNL